MDAPDPSDVLWVDLHRPIGTCASGRQSLIEEGGKKEIYMMIPVVFLVLPVTVLFIAYPGLSMLRLSL